MYIDKEGKKSKDNIYEKLPTTLISDNDKKDKEPIFKIALQNHLTRNNDELEFFKGERIKLIKEKLVR